MFKFHTHDVTNRSREFTLLEEFQVPSNAGAEIESLNVLEYLRYTYAKNGTDTWPSKSAECFLVRLTTKVLVDPHGLHTDSTVPEI